jgi:hypothetical protein
MHSETTVAHSLTFKLLLLETYGFRKCTGCKIHFDFPYSLYTKYIMRYLAPNWCKRRADSHAGNLSDVGVIF